jgi:hypothetical protein
MTDLESEVQRLSRAMQRLMQVSPPRLAPARPRVHRVLSAVVASVAGLVVVAGVVGGSIVLHSRVPTGNPPIAGSSPTASPSATVLPSFSADPIVEIAELPTWMTVCLHEGGIVVTPPPASVRPSLTPAQVIADARAADSRVEGTSAPAFLQFWAVPYGGQTDESKALAQPVWAVGVDDIHFPAPGVYVPGNLATPKPSIGPIIYFVDDPSGTVGFELGCPSS